MVAAARTLPRETGLSALIGIQADLSTHTRHPGRRDASGTRAALRAGPREARLATQGAGIAPGLRPSASGMTGGVGIYTRVVNFEVEPARQGPSLFDVRAVIACIKGQLVGHQGGGVGGLGDGEVGRQIVLQKSGALELGEARQVLDRLQA